MFEFFQEIKFVSRRNLRHRRRRRSRCFSGVKRLTLQTEKNYSKSISKSRAKKRFLAESVETRRKL